MKQYFLLTLLLTMSYNSFATSSFSQYYNNSSIRYSGNNDCMVGTKTSPWNLHKTLYAVLSESPNVKNTRVGINYTFSQNQKYQNYYGAWVDKWVNVGSGFLGRMGEYDSIVQAVQTYYYHFTPNWNQFRISADYYRLEEFPFNPNGWRQIYLNSTDSNTPNPYQWGYHAYENCFLAP